MPLILNLETATKSCSVALAENGNVIALKELVSEQFSHAEKLNLFIEDVLKEANRSMNDLSAVAVSAGPGSYTGLRIGSSTAKGICYALDLPLISINSLMALASLRSIESGLICPMFDARRMEVYSAVYTSELQIIKPTDAVIIDKHSFEDLLGEGKMLFLGPGAEKCREVINHPNADFDLGTEVSAAGMVGLSYAKYLESQFEDVAYFEPAYLKDFIAGTPKKLI